jgi:hypothetical protein
MTSQSPTSTSLDSFRWIVWFLSGLVGLKTIWTTLKLLYQFLDDCFTRPFLGECSWIVISILSLPAWYSCSIFGVKLRHAPDHSRRVVSICTGAFVLAEAGLAYQDDLADYR